MSYDLYFKPRAGTFDANRFLEYFNARPHYNVDDSQAFYQNEDTGVYFIFELQNEADQEDGEFFPVSFNLNFFRPSTFGLEAEPEVTAFVNAFDFTVSDPQSEGMGDGEYSAELFLRGWNHGNEFGYNAILSRPENRENIVSLPTDQVIDAWAWNRDRKDLQLELGELKFVPLVIFVLIDGEPATAAVWPDGIPIAVPSVDYFIVPRKEFAPKRFFRRVEDQTLVSESQVLPIFNRFSTTRLDGTLVLNYNDPPKEIRSFVESLPGNERKMMGVTTDKMLNRELVEKYLV